MSQTVLQVQRPPADDQFHEWSERLSRLHPGAKGVRNDVIYFSPLPKPLSKCRVALLTSAGINRPGVAPFDGENELGDPSYRDIPAGTPSNVLKVGHTHFNHADADRDINCIFPIDRIKELAAEGFIGSVAPVHYSIMGFVPDPTPLVTTTGPELARLLRAEGADIVFITPG